MSFQVPKTCCVLKNNDYLHPEPVNITACYSAAMNINLTDASQYVHTKVRETFFEAASHQESRLTFSGEGDDVTRKLSRSHHGKDCIACMVVISGRHFHP